MSDRPGEMDERDVDERFASIIADWDTAELAPEPVSRAGDEPVAPAPEPPAARPPWVNASPFEGVVPASSWRVVEPPVPEAVEAVEAAVAADDDEHFEPPDVELPPQEDLHFWGAVVGLVAGPLCLVYVAMARPFHSTRWFVAGVVLSLLGFGLLVLRQPRDRDEDDDGARI